MGATETIVEEIKVVEETKVETIVETEKKETCNLSNKTACKVYLRGLELGLTKEQSLIATAISVHETGWFKSTLYKNKNNFGGITAKKGFASYSTNEEGLDAFLTLLKKYYFGKGLNTIEKIGAKYCPVGAKNDPKGLNKNWVRVVTSLYNQFTKQV